jgi:hypothetical protein
MPDDEALEHASNDLNAAPMKEKSNSAKKHGKDF